MRTINRFMVMTAMILGAQAKAFDAHEWGTFTSLVGSDGKTQNGMYHEDEPLPDFVYGFGEVRQNDVVSNNSASILGGRPPCDPDNKGCIPFPFIQQNVISQKMETPVIYFYSSARQNEVVNVNVKFPEGVVTESFPGPIATSPLRTDAPILANGNTTYQVEILRESTNKSIPFVEAGNIYGYARNAASNVVRSGSEYEKFIFYRGLGRFQPEINITSAGSELSIRTNERNRPLAMFLVHVDENGDAQGYDLFERNESGHDISVSEQMISELRDHRFDRKTGPLRSNQLQAGLIFALIQSGLFVDEARAMLDTWNRGYLTVPGLRLLYILPRSEVDLILPVEMNPAPQRFERAFVARVEVMLDSDERELLGRIASQGAFFDVRSLGRFAEPMLRRLRQVAIERREPRPVLDNIDRLIYEATASGSGGDNGTVSLVF